MRRPPKIPAGTQVRLSRLDGTGGGQVKFIGVLNGALLYCALTKDQVNAVRLDELRYIEICAQDGKHLSTWAP